MIKHHEYIYILVFYSNISYNDFDTYLDFEQKLQQNMKEPNRNAI